MLNLENNYSYANYYRRRGVRIKIQFSDLIKSLLPQITNRIVFLSLVGNGNLLFVKRVIVEMCAD